MFTAFRFRLYPSPDQQQRLAVQFGNARWVWNDALELTQQTYRDTGKGLPFRVLSARLPKLKKQVEWLAEADSQVLQQALQNLAAAFDNFFHKRSSYPQFKRKQDRQSVQYPQRVKIEGKRAYLPKVGWVKVIAHRVLTGRIKTVTVTKEPCGHYYASVLMEDGVPIPDPVMPEGGRFTGIDVGLTDLAVTSKGQHFTNPRHLLKAERNLARKQQKLSRKQKGSKSREKARRLVARAHERVKNARKDYLHKLSRRLVDENQALAVEDLNVKAMVRSLNLGKAISSVGWGMLAAFCRYKCERAGKFFVRTGRFFPSTKACSACGRINHAVVLGVEAWTCPGCGIRHDRDENAAKNIGMEADRMFAAGLTKAHGTGASAGRGSVSHKKRLDVSRARPDETGSRPLCRGR